MSNWAEVLSSNGEPILINLDRIDLMAKEDSKHTMLYFTGRIITVRETYEQMFQIIKEK